MDIYSVNIINKLNVGLYDNFLSLIDDAKKTKINKFKNSDDKIRTLIADILIRSIICNKLQIFNKEIKYEYNIYGKPKLKDNKDFHFSVSHSGNWVIAIIDNKPIGIDIEQICPINYIDIAKISFNYDEYNWLLSQKKQKRLECFYKLWTLKESYIKMTGTGLATPLDSFSILFDTEYNISIKNESNSASEVYFKTYTIDKNYKLAVCSENNDFTSKINFMNYEMLYKKLLFAGITL
ncbi:4'-phosphopantetheinyl transferase superfamily protein [Clostridium tagluense]|uniref:4'-phosphopantetheinyl transferase family protein n=1 Tax=Clostridium TaxID=1485 RepID=UPI0013E95D83|nr:MULTISPECIES: 4'-phosphopantetheinyl transferase superfamily protein [Clostridium]MBZ9623629.1 4'-phosphopantetheinyl transferase superfamily protein [Clostridium sp. FP2]MBZ9635054.1 4'-phosphopantetheinyl transferase superfamily protein [Clostridium sp. FP1]MCB2312204.1 4'-phosphopantetheinyl transferase superfamily protein [Clostridium tagluense]MCB2316791.1 4'-phosphopantetheinyl transferase superfamily protein [Clostridium tagluense]MCB2321651.1 4'-phosphopantetheinyl transferase super